MLQATKVSVIMPVYNGGQYLRRAVSSVLNQTYSDIEILIINDGSTDGGWTDDIGRELQSNFPDKIRYFYQENTGVAGALNKGIDNMCGQFFCWLSHDDLYLPEKIERQIEYIAACQQGDIFLYGDWEYIGPNDEHLYDVKLDGDHLKGPSIAAVLGGAVNGCTVMISRASLGDSRFDLRYRCVQDYRLWFELAQRLTFVRHPEILVQQRLHPGQDTNRLKDVAIREGEALWQDMIFGTSQILRAAMDGSNYRFLNRMGQRLAQMPYPITYAQVMSAASRALDAINLTVILIDGDIASSDASEFMKDLANDESCQIIAVEKLGSKQGAALTRGRQVRIVSNLQQALDLSEGEYIAFTSVADPASLRTLRRQARSMSVDGGFVSVRFDDPSSASLDVSRILIAAPPPIARTMVHRHLIASGELNGSDIDVAMPGNCLRLLSTQRSLILDAQGEQVSQ